MSNSSRRRRGLLFVISSPSGAGKTTLSNRLRQSHDDLILSISATTRPPRDGEIDGVDYQFITRAEFARRREAGFFYEWAEVHGNLYGTPRAPVQEILNDGQDVLLDVDWQGAQQMLAHRDEDVVSVFILPPSMVELERRLRTRAKDAEEIIQRRLHGGREEISHWREYNYVLVNDDADVTAAALDAILRAERLRCGRQPWISRFVDGLMAET